MIKVTIELLPFGKESGATALSVIDIRNSLESFDDKYIYDYTASLKNKGELEEITGTVVHDRDSIVFNLVEDVIKDIVRKKTKI